MIVREIARYANENDCYILSGDADMFVMSNKGVIFIDDLKAAMRKNNQGKKKKEREMKSQIPYFCRYYFMNLYNINYYHFLYLSIIPGNDFCKQTSLKHDLFFAEEEKQTFDHALKYVQSLPKKFHMENLQRDYRRHHPRSKSNIQAIVQKNMEWHYPNRPERLIQLSRNKQYLNNNKTLIMNYYTTLDNTVSSRIYTILFTPVINYGSILSSPYQDICRILFSCSFLFLVMNVDERIIMNIRRVMEPQGLTPFVSIKYSGISYYPSKEAYNSMYVCMLS